MWTSQPKRARYFENPAHLRPPTAPSGGKWYVMTSRRRVVLVCFTEERDGNDTARGVIV
jgi:hypothetical protein